MSHCSSASKITFARFILSRPISIESCQRRNNQRRSVNTNIQNTGSGHTHVRHAEPTHSRKSNGGGRNSSIELLRIIAMFMILAYHFVGQSGYKIENLPLSPQKVFFQLIMLGGGKVGVVIFSLFPHGSSSIKSKPSNPILNVYGLWSESFYSGVSLSWHATLRSVVTISTKNL